VGSKRASGFVPSDDPEQPNAEVELAGTGLYFMVQPARGTVGSRLTLSGEGLGTKGKVTVGGVTLKISEWTGSLIRGDLTKAPEVGLHDVMVQSKEMKKTKTSLLEKGIFSVVVPEVRKADRTPGTSGDKWVLHGRFYGTKKGKVTLDGKACKVSIWEMDSATGEGTIEASCPGGLSSGIYELKVVNKVGQGAFQFTLP
jgi:hypothetical protein